MAAILASLIVLLVWCGMIQRRQGRAGVTLVLAGLAIGVVIYPVLIGVGMGLLAAAGEPIGRWEAFRDVGIFYTFTPLNDTVPRGAVLGGLASRSSPDRPPRLLARGWSVRARRRRNPLSEP